MSDNPLQTGVCIPVAAAASPSLVTHKHLTGHTQCAASISMQGAMLRCQVQRLSGPVVTSHASTSYNLSIPSHSCRRWHRQPFTGLIHRLGTCSRSILCSSSNGGTSTKEGVTDKKLQETMADLDAILGIVEEPKPAETQVGQMH